MSRGFREAERLEYLEEEKARLDYLRLKAQQRQGQQKDNLQTRARTTDWNPATKTPAHNQYVRLG